MGRPDGPAEQGPRGVHKRVYGLCLVHRETYEQLVGNGRSELAEEYSCDGYPGEHRSPLDREPDCAVIKALLSRCLGELSTQYYNASKTSRDVVKFDALSRVCSLSADGMQLRQVGADDSTPPLSRVLGSFDGALFGADFKHLLQDSMLPVHELIKRGVSSAEGIPDLDELLSQLWSCQHLKTRMYDVHAHFHPSLYAGQDSNYGSILELSRATLQGVWSEAINSHVIDGGEGSVSLLDDELAKMEALTAGLRDQLIKIRAQAALEASQWAVLGGDSPRP